MSTAKTTTLVMSALEQALSTRRRGNAASTTPTSFTTPTRDARQYLPLAFTEALTEDSIAGSISSVGDALHNALMESMIGPFKTELIDRQRS